MGAQHGPGRHYRDAAASKLNAELCAGCGWAAQGSPGPCMCAIRAQDKQRAPLCGEGVRGHGLWWGLCGGVSSPRAPCRAGLWLPLCVACGMRPAALECGAKEEGGMQVCTRHGRVGATLPCAGHAHVLRSRAALQQVPINCTYYSCE